MSWLFSSGGQGIVTSASVLPMNIQGLFLLGWTGLISLRDSQESSLAPQFKGINSLALSLLYGPTLTSIHDYWKNQLYFHLKNGKGNHRVKNALQYSTHERSHIYLIHKHCVSNEQGIGFLFWFLPFLVSQI